MGTTLDEKAIPKCLDRLEKAREALFHVRNAATLDAFKSAYAEFLIHTGGVLNALAAGANASPQGRQWYGSTKRFERNDEMLRYLHQARHVEEHSTDDTHEFSGGGISIGGPLRREPGEGVRGLYMGNQAIVEMSTGKPVLLPLIDRRYGTHFPVPTVHLSKRIGSQNPLVLGELYLEYLTNLVKGASLLS